MKLIIGLGNPGITYENTRHNAGFMAMDEIAKELGISISKNQFEAKVAKVFINGESVLLMKPETFMNNSGFALRQAMDYYKIAPEDILVLYDDMDTAPGQIRLRQKGSAGGHNGVKSILSALLGNQNFNRIRIGIGREPKIKTIDYVLGKFPPDDREKVQAAARVAAKAAIESISTPFEKVMSQYNPKHVKKQRVKETEKAKKEQGSLQAREEGLIYSYSAPESQSETETRPDKPEALKKESEPDSLHSKESESVENKEASKEESTERKQKGEIDGTKG